jgi:glucose/arabinose dehydrogenase
VDHRPTALCRLTAAAVAALLAACQSTSVPLTPGGTAGAPAPTGISGTSGAPRNGSTRTTPLSIALRPVASGLSAPVGIANAGDGSGRLFVNEQAGLIRVIEAGGRLDPSPFADLRSLVLVGGERGLLGMAFHPSFSTNRRFFVDYTRRPDGNIVIAEYRATPDGRRLDPSSQRILLTIEHSAQSNHNGGQIAFGPDGYLYAAVGDPSGAAQDTGSLLGKILRIDVDARPTGGRAYAIPAGNPFARGGGAPEVWAYGLRNPWRFSFDRPSGDLYIGDAGQNAWEEIDRQAGGAPGGADYGWPIMEGRHCYATSDCDPGRYVAPLAEYGHDLGCAVTGGYVYRGSAQPRLRGLYLFADYCSGRIFDLPVDGSHGSVAPRQLLRTDPGVASFGLDEAGEVYLANANTGLIARIVAQ